MVDRSLAIIWSTPARDDLKAIHDYIARDSKRYAIRVTQDIRDKVKTLIEFPDLGKCVAEIGEEHVREIHMYSYRILYEVTPDIIYIHGVIHKRRDFKAEDLAR
jgi:plasmid stabilization system protein ParE